MKKKILLLLMSSVLVFPSLSFASDAQDGEVKTVECCASTSAPNQQVCCDSDCKTYLKMMNRAPNAECGWVTDECCITDYGTNLDLTVTQTCCEAVTTTETVFKSNQCCVKDTPFALAIPGKSMSEMTKECCEEAGGKWIGSSGDGVCCVEGRPRLFKGKDSSGKVEAGDLNEKCCVPEIGMWMDGYCCAEPGFTVECKDAKGTTYHKLRGCSTKEEVEKKARSICQQAMTQDDD